MVLEFLPTSPIASPAVLVRASAGSGKTTRLALRMLALLVTGIHPRHILATTFTKKAAGEIASRVFERLAKAVIHEQEATRLAADLGIKAPSDGLFDRVLLALVSEQHHLKIGTIDSWALRLARMFHVELGLPATVRPSIAAIDRLVATQALIDIFDAVPEEAARSIAEVLDADLPRRAILARAIRILREGNLLLTLAPPHSWQGAFSPEDGQGSPHPFDATMEALRLAPLPRNKKGEENKHWVRAREQVIAAASSNDWEQIVTNFVLSIAEIEGTYYGLPPTPELQQACRDLIILAQQDVREAMVTRLRSLEYILHAFASRVLERQRLLGALGFDDIKACLARRSVPSLLGEMAYRIDGAIHHLLLDEFQDTSLADWALIAPLAEEILSHSDGSRTFFCVGDEKQAIYGWRGGTVETFSALESQYTPGDLRTEELAKCYRCAPQILDFVNHAFTNLPRIVGETLAASGGDQFYSLFTAHVPGRHHQGFVQFLEGESPRIEEGEESLQEEEGTGVVSMMTTWHIAAGEIRRIHEHYPSASIGVLFRTNNDATRFARVLAAPPYNVAASEETSEFLGEDQGVAALLALLTFVEHPTNTANLFALSLTPFASYFGISFECSAPHLCATSRRLTLALRTLGLAAALSEWSRILTKDNFIQDTARIQDLIILATTLADATPVRLDTFIAIAQHHPVERSSEAKVRILTLHKSKGLEFDVVVLPHVSQAPIPPRSFEQPAFLHNISPHNLAPRQRRTTSDGAPMVLPFPKEFVRKLFPQVNSLYEAEKQKEIYEELCLLYVALTRPRIGLIMVTEKDGEGGSKRMTQGRILRESWRSFTTSRNSTDTSSERDITLTYGDIEGALGAFGPTGGDIHPPPVAPTGAPRLLETPLRFAPIPPSALRRAPRRITTESKSLSASHTSLSDISPELYGRGLSESATQANSEALRFGAHVHLLLATLGWVAPDAPIFPDKDDAPSRMVQQAFAAPAFAALFSKDFLGQRNAARPNTLWREKPFAVMHEGNILSGRFDRVTITGDTSKALLIDFKVHKEDESPRALIETYRAQMILYNTCLKKLLYSAHLRISLLLAFLPSGEVWYVTDCGAEDSPLHSGEQIKDLLQ